MMKNVSLVAICLGALLTCTIVEAAEPLLWKFRVGDAHRYRMLQVMDMEMSFGATGQKISTGIDQTLDMTWRVEGIDEQGDAQVSQTIDRVQMDMQAPGQQNMHYDTKSKEPPAGFAAMLDPLFKAMTAKPFQVVMSPRGKFRDLKLPEGFIDALKAAPGAAMMGEMFSDDGFQKMIQQSSLVLPKPEDLTLGHEWTAKSQVENPQLGTITTEVTYRYVGPREVEGVVYEVFDVKLKMDFGEGKAGMQLEIADQQSNGEILFNRDEGRLESSSMQQTIEMVIHVGEQEMSQTMTQKLKFERREKTDDETPDERIPGGKQP